MASIQDENEQNQLDQQSAAQSASPQAQAPVVSTQSSAAPQNSGRFSNVSNYLKANQGFNANRGGLAGKIVNNVQGQANAVKQNLANSYNAFQNDADKNKVTYNKDAVEGVLGNLSNGVSDAQAKAFQEQRDAKYTGPQGLSNTPALQSDIQNLQNTGNNVNTAQGRFSLLRNMFNRPGYSQGAQRLDNLLLQGNQDQLAKLNQVRRDAIQTQSDYDNNNASAEAIAQNYANQAQQVANTTKQQYVDAEAKAKADLDAQVEAVKQQRLNQLDNIGLTDPNAPLYEPRKFSEEDLARFGLKADDRTFGIDPFKYLTVNNQVVDKNNAATDAQRTTFNSLAKLAGGENTYLPDSNKNDLNYSYDLGSGYRTAVNQKAADYNTAIADPTARMNADNIKAQSASDFMNYLNTAGDSIYNTDSEGGRSINYNALENYAKSLDDKYGVTSPTAFNSAQHALNANYGEGFSVDNFLNSLSRGQQEGATSAGAYNAIIEGLKNQYNYNSTVNPTMGMGKGKGYS